MFLCEYLHSEQLRQEIQEGLNIIELWNGVNDLFSMDAAVEISSNKREDQETSMLCLHLLQNCLVYINTLMIQQVLSEPKWHNRLTPQDSEHLHLFLLSCQSLWNLSFGYERKNPPQNVD